MKRSDKLYSAIRGLTVLLLLYLIWTGNMLAIKIMLTINLFAWAVQYRINNEPQSVRVMRWEDGDAVTVDEAIRQGHYKKNTSGYQPARGKKVNPAPPQGGSGLSHG